MSENICTLRVSRVAAGAYPTISDALAAADQLYPDAEQPVRIHIDPGEYRERVEIHRPRVTLVGETADSVRIVGSLGAKMPSSDGSGVDGTLGTFRTYTCTMHYEPWPSSLSIAGVSLGAPAVLTHERAVTVDPWRPGVVM